jgi:hypothetical protein
MAEGTREPLSIAERDELLSKLIGVRTGPDWRFFRQFLIILLRDSWKEDLINEPLAELKRRGDID